MYKEAIKGMLELILCCNQPINFDSIDVGVCPLRKDEQTAKDNSSCKRFVVRLKLDAAYR
jgi:hypothetical protein